MSESFGLLKPKYGLCNIPFIVLKGILFKLFMFGFLLSGLLILLLLLGMIELI